MYLSTFTVLNDIDLFISTCVFAACSSSSQNNNKINFDDMTLRLRRVISQNAVISKTKSTAARTVPLWGGRGGGTFPQGSEVMTRATPSPAVGLAPET